MNNGRKIRIQLYLIIAALILVVSIVAIISFADKKNKESKVKIGFIMTGATDEGGWNTMHYDGISKACEELDVELVVKENVKEANGECRKAVEELLDDGVGMIILASYGYSDEVIDLVNKNPGVKFYTNSSEIHSNNMSSYFVRYYQARYLSGVLAGMKTKCNKIGYVAAMSNNEVNRGISAFTLGVKSVNPDARVIVSYSGEWDNKEKEIKCAQKLISEGVDLMTYHQNQDNIIEVCDKAGIYSIGYHQYMKGHSDKYLTAVVCDWKLTYKEIVSEFLKGKANTVDNYWIGIEKEVIGLSKYSDLVTDEEKKAVEEAKERLLRGEDVFSGLIYDNNGNLKSSEGEIISDDIILEHFDWLVEGVEVYEE